MDRPSNQSSSNNNNSDREEEEEEKDENLDDNNVDCKPTAAAVVTTTLLDSLLVDDDDDDPEDHHRTTTMTMTPPRPPSSVHGEAGDHIATIVEDEPTSWDDDHHHHHPRPQKPELTLKEKLVMRERQRRIEAERARLKRQFILSSSSSSATAAVAAAGTQQQEREASLQSDQHQHMLLTDDTDEEGNRIDPAGFPPIGNGGTRNGDDDDDEFLAENEEEENDHDHDEESMRAHPDEDGGDAATESLGFNMERFLRNSETFNPQLEPMYENHRNNKNNKNNNNHHHHHHEEKGVLMERFLKDVVAPDPVVLLPLPPPPAAEESSIAVSESHMIMMGEGVGGGGGGSSSHRSVSFDMDTSAGGGMMILSPLAPHVPLSSPPLNEAATVAAKEDGAVGRLHMMAQSASSPPVVVGRSSGLGVDPDGSLRVEAPSSVASSSEGGEGAVHAFADSTSSHHHLHHNNPDEPRMLRLTEADMLEMASIDEASIGNAPPSDRDEVMSEIGELAEFTAAAAAHDRRIGRGGGGSHDTPTTALESSSQMSGGDNHSQVFVLAAPSVASSADGPSPSVPHSRHHRPSSFFDDSTRAIAADDSLPDHDTDGDMIMETTTPLDHHDLLMSNGLADDLSPHASSPITTPGVLDNNNNNDDNDSVVSIANGGGEHNNNNILYANRPRRHQSISPETIDDSVAAAPSEAHSSTVVDGFDYDKDAPRSTHDNTNNNIHDQNDDHLLVMNDDSFDRGDRNPMDSWCADDHQMQVSPLHNTAQRLVSATAANPFPAPPFYGAKSSMNQHRHSHLADEESAPLLLRQKTTATVSMRKDDNVDMDIERYIGMNAWERALSGRHVIVAVCTTFEVLVACLLLTIAPLMCNKVGLRRFVLMFILLPLVLTVTGNVGFQNRILTRAAVPAVARSEIAIRPWCVTELKVAALLSGGVGLVIGFVAFLASSSDLVFAVVIALGTFISGIGAAVMGHFKAYYCERIVDQFPTWKKLIDRLTFNFVGCTAFMGICFLLLPEDSDDDLSCPFG